MKASTDSRYVFIIILMEFIKTIFAFAILSTIINTQLVIPASPSAKATTLTYVSGSDFASLVNKPNNQPQSTSKLSASPTQNEGLPITFTAQSAQSSSISSSSTSKSPSQTQASASPANTGSSQTNPPLSSRSTGNLPPLNINNTPQPDQITPNTATQSNQLKTQSLTTNPSASTIMNTGYYNYITATTAFTSLNQLRKTCNSQSQLKYVAFKQYSTQYYLTSNTYFLSLVQSNSPTNQQLFTAIQNIDCSWSFLSNDGLYLSLNTGFSYLTLSSVLSVGQRFYIQRKQDWIYIESASSYRYFWTVSNGIVLINMNQASKFILEMWPQLSVGWN